MFHVYRASALCAAFGAGLLAVSGCSPNWDEPAANSKPTIAPTASASKVKAKSAAAAKSRPAKPAPAIAYRKETVAGVPLHVVQIDARRPEVRVTVATPSTGIGGRDSWSEFINRTRPAAAITGTYFCTQTGVPVGSIITEGRLLNSGAVGTAFTFASGRGAQLISSRPGVRTEWPGAETVLRAGPRLLKQGRVALNPRAEGFRDPAIFARKRRTAVALTEHGKLLLVAVEQPVYLRTLAEALRKLGAVEAMCLDGGGSTALYAAGRSRVKTSRPLTNVLVIYETNEQYQRAEGAINPVPLIAGKPEATG